MKCPKCGGKLGVIDTFSEGTSVYRRRKCKECGYLCYSVENIVPYNSEIGSIFAYRNTKYAMKRSNNK